MARRTSSVEAHCAISNGRRSKRRFHMYRDDSNSGSFGKITRPEKPLANRSNRCASTNSVFSWLTTKAQIQNIKLASPQLDLLFRKPLRHSLDKLMLGPLDICAAQDSQKH